MRVILIIMKISVLLFLFIFVGCAQAPTNKSGKSKAKSIARDKLFVNQLERRQVEKDQELLLGKKYQIDGRSNRFHVVPQHKKLDLQVASELDIYDHGLRMLVDRNYGEALLYFNRVIQKSPGSFSARSAMFQKAVLFKKMNLPEESRKALISLKLKFPGSLEAKRADIVLKTAN